jgi:[citrate (pro-3S)-lyase] ligase
VLFFAEHIAPELGITVRYAGEEPLDNVTRQYNESMRKLFPQKGIEFVEIRRKENANEVISASRVRGLLKEEAWDQIQELVPQTTYDYLRKNEEMILKRLN